MSRKLYDKSKSEKIASLNEDLRSVGNSTLKSTRDKQKQVNFGGESEDDELVKYMSSLPGYLERGKNIHEKVLNVGVLDWSRLEQWQHRHHKHVPLKGKRTSASTSATNTSSPVPAEGSSVHSVDGGSPSTSCQRLSRPSLQSYFMASTAQDLSFSDKTSGENVGKCHNLRGGLGNMDSQSKLVRGDEYLSQNLDGRRLKGCSKKDSYPNSSTESKILPSDYKFHGASRAKLQNGIQDSELEKRKETLQEPNIKIVEQGKIGRSKPIDLRMPNDIPQNGLSDRRISFGQKSGTTMRTSLSEKSNQCFPSDTDNLHSCPPPENTDANHSQAEGCSSLDAGNIRIPIATSSTLQLSKIRTHQSPLRSLKVEERKQTEASIPSATEPSQGLGQKGKSEKSRSSSPFGRFGFSMSYTSKGASCKESLHAPHKSSMPAVRSGAETMRVSSSSCISGRNNSVDAGRSRTSPLRRLLDPLLKPKEAHCRHSVELSSQRDPRLTNNADVAYPHLQSGKELDRNRRVSCSSINACDSLGEKKNASLTSRALLRITVKNGHPLFTFAVDNDSNVLVAKVKTLVSSRKDGFCCIYTFFCFNEVKKKNGNWINQAGKSKGSNYIHQVVAQMKVSNSHLYDLTGENCVDFSTVKEFVLFSVELKQGNGEASDYQPNDELAAIVLKIPKSISFTNNMHQGSCHNGSKLFHATVVLPSGVHSLPSRGGPSSLIERWKSGGSCDCGGWDLGCKLKVLENKNESCKSSKPPKAYFAEQFELFLQVNGQDHVPAFSMTPFTHGIYSVVFDSSLSPLQAFSTCIALLDNNMSYELSGSRDSMEVKTPRETLSMQNDGTKVLRKLEDIPASYISYPPLSPVGRV